MWVHRDTCPQEEALTVESAFPKIPLSLSNVLLAFIILLSALHVPWGLYGDYTHKRGSHLWCTTRDLRAFTLHLQLENPFSNYFFYRVTNKHFHANLFRDMRTLKTVRQANLIAVQKRTVQFAACFADTSLIKSNYRMFRFRQTKARTITQIHPKQDGRPVASPNPCVRHLGLAKTVLYH